MDILTTHQTIVAGDDYKAADNRALWWESGEWPDLAGATLTMVIGKTEFDLYGSFPITLTDTVPSSPAQPSIVSFTSTPQPLYVATRPVSVYADSYSG